MKEKVLVEVKGSFLVMGGRSWSEKQHEHWMVWEHRTKEGTL